VKDDITGLVLSDIAVTAVLKGPEDLFVIGEIIESPRVLVVIYVGTTATRPLHSSDLLSEDVMQPLC
jgi:hypothetical protein